MSDTVKPSDKNSCKESENLQGAAGSSTKEAELQMVTDEDREDIRLKKAKVLKVEKTGAVSFGTSVLKDILKGSDVKVDDEENLFTLRSLNVEPPESAMMCGESIKDTFAEFSISSDSRENTAERLEKLIPMDTKEGSESDDSSSTEILEDFNRTVEPSDENFPKESENLPGVTGSSTEEADLQMVTDENREEDIRLKKIKDVELWKIGSVISGTSVLKDMLIGLGMKLVDEDIFTLPGSTFKPPEFAMEYDEPIKDASIEFSVPPDSAEGIDKCMEELTVNRIKQMAEQNIEVVDIQSADVSKDFNSEKKRLLSEFEKKGGTNVFDKNSDHVTQIKESYLTVNNENVKHLHIYEPSYDLISKDYKPMVDFVDKSYRIVIDVSSFSLGNIVVHVADDMVDVYATENHEDMGGYKCVKFHKAYKMPRNVNKEKLCAHMLKPLKLLCICAPVEVPVQ